MWNTHAYHSGNPPCSISISCDYHVVAAAGLLAWLCDCVQSSGADQKQGEASDAVCSEVRDRTKVVPVTTHARFPFLLPLFLLLSNGIFFQIKTSSKPTVRKRTLTFLNNVFPF